MGGGSIIPLDLELSQFLLSLINGSRLVNPLEVARDLFAHFPTDIVQAVAHQMHDAQLYRGVWIDGFNRFGKAFQTVDTGDEDVYAPRFFRSVNTCNQNLAPSAWTIHKPSTSFSPLR